MQVGSLSAQFNSLQLTLFTQLNEMTELIKRNLVLENTVENLNVDLNAKNMLSTGIYSLNIQTIFQENQNWD